MAADLGTDTSFAQRTISLPFPNGLGGVVYRDVTCIQPALDMHTSSGRAQLAEHVVCMLTTARGTIIDTAIPSTTANLGTDVNANLNDDYSARNLAMFAADVDAETRKDQRVVRSSTKATAVGEVLMLACNLTDGAGPFSLVFALTTSGVQTLSGQP